MDFTQTRCFREFILNLATFYCVYLAVITITEPTTYHVIKGFCFMVLDRSALPMLPH
jgi:hypothetical protein